MLVDFDVDCGEVLAGRRLIARGLRYDGYSHDRMLSDYAEHVPGKPVHRMVALTYALVPGLSTDEQENGPFVHAGVVLEPPADPDHWDAVLNVGEEQENATGSDETKGAIGPFVLPDATRRVTVELGESMPVRSTQTRRPGEDEGVRVAGRLEIDIATGQASWIPA